MANTMTDHQNRKYRSLAAALEDAGVSVEARKGPGVVKGISAAKRAFGGLLAGAPLWLCIEYALEIILCEHPELPGGSPVRKLQLQAEVERYVPYQDVMNVAVSITEALRVKRRR